MRTLTREASGLAVWLAAALTAGGMALGWSPTPDGAAAQSSTREIRGTVLGSSGEPVEGIDVQAFGDFGEDNWGPWSALPTTADGSFRIEVPAGNFRLRLSLEFGGGGTCYLGYFGSDGRRAPLREVTPLVVAGEDVRGLAITLSGVRSELCQSVEGVVVDGEGKPVAGTRSPSGNTSREANGRTQQAHSAYTSGRERIL